MIVGNNECIYDWVRITPRSIDSPSNIFTLEMVYSLYSKFGISVPTYCKFAKDDVRYIAHLIDYLGLRVNPPKLTVDPKAVLSFTEDPERIIETQINSMLRDGRLDGISIDSVEHIQAEYVRKKRPNLLNKEKTHFKPKVIYPPEDVECDSESVHQAVELLRVLIRPSHDNCIEELIKFFNINSSGAEMILASIVNLL